MIEREDLIVQHYDPGHERPWYVQEVSLLDMGRFKTKEDALAHREFLLQRKYRI